MNSSKSLILVCDDAGYTSVNRGIQRLVDATGKPVSAEFMITQPGAVESARGMGREPLVSRGLHFEISGITDADRFHLGKALMAAGTSLGEEAGIRAQATVDAPQQLAIFRDALGVEPDHISTHGDFNVDKDGQVMPWWRDLVHKMFGDNPPPMQLDIKHVRHNKYGWNRVGTRRPPLTPEEFGDVLRGVRDDHDVIEFVMHPAYPQTGDSPIDMLFDADMRIADLNSAIDIIRSGVIEAAGFEIVPMSSLKKQDEQPVEPRRMAAG